MYLYSNMYTIGLGLYDWLLNIHFYNFLFCLSFHHFMISVFQFHWFMILLSFNSSALSLFCLFHSITLWVFSVSPFHCYINFLFFPLLYDFVAFQFHGFIILLLLSTDFLPFLCIALILLYFHSMVSQFCFVFAFHGYMILLSSHSIAFMIFFLSFYSTALWFLSFHLMALWFNVSFH